MRRSGWFALLCLLPLATAQAGEDSHEQALRLAEETARLAVLNADTDTLSEVWSANLVVSTPRIGIAGERARILNAFESGAVGYELYEQTIELIRIDGDSAVVMGTEVARSDSEADLVHRRFTHAWVWREDRWLLLARHAHYLQE